MARTSFQVGPSRWSQGGYINIVKYHNNEVALVVDSADGDSQCCATVSIPGAPRTPGKVWLKGWTENEGVPEAMVAAGLVTLTGRTWPSGFAEAQEAELSPALAAAVQAVLGPSTQKEPRP